MAAQHALLASSNGSHGSLVLGGYDERRMVRNEVVFPFNKDILRLHVAWVEKIVFEGHGRATFGLDQTNYKCRIDSTLPFISLPPAIYDEVVQTLGLQQHNLSGYPIVPDEALTTLAE